MPDRPSAQSVQAICNVRVLHPSASSPSIAAFFEPRTVAVVGVSRRRNRIGSEIVHNLIATGFTGVVAPVNPEADEIQGLKAYPRVTNIPGTVDLAVIAVPAARVDAAVDDCLVKGVRAICIISAGFAECNEDGRAHERALVGRIRRAGCRLIGPNCMGLLNTDPRFMLNATFSPVYPPAGCVAMSTQSGALGLAILDYARQLNTGISSFASIGNKADVSGNDLLQHWENDPRTSVILLYLENFGNPAKFSRLARRIGRHKPIVALKSGRSTIGARAAASHTGALASSDSFVDALFHQTGVIRTDTVAELFDVASMLARQPVPRGRRVAILTNAGGPAILAADACQAHGLVAAELSALTVSALRSFLPAAASVGNPVDMLASAAPDHYRRALRLLLDDDSVDSAIVIFIPPLVTNADEVASAIAETAAHAGKPVAGVFMRSQAAPSTLASVPCYGFPEPAAIALAKVAAYGDWRRRPQGSVTPLANLQPTLARLIVDSAMHRGGGWLTPVEANALMAAVGIATPRSFVAGSVEGAIEAAANLRGPVAVKAVGAALLHKTEHQAVRLGLDTEAAVERAALELKQSLGDMVEGLLVQEMVKGGVEMTVGAIHDPIFGHVIACGSGGVLIDLLADSAYCLHPVTDRDASEMVESLKGVRLLRGYRGSVAADEAAFRDAIVRISALVGLCPEIQELDVNPLTVLSEGVSAVDVRVRVGNPHARLGTPGAVS